MPPDTSFINAQCNTQLAHFILEQFAQRLNELQLHCCRESTNIMMSFDSGTWTLVRNTLNNIRIKSSLEQEITSSCISLNFLCLLLEDVDECPTNDLTFLFGIGNTLEQIQESIFGINTSKVDMAVISHSLENIHGLILSQASIIYQYRMESIPDGPCHQNGGHRRINATTHSTNYMSIRTNFSANLLNEFVGIIRHDPVLLRFGDGDYEVFKNILAKGRVCHFWVELQSPHLGRDVFNSDKVSIRCPGHCLEPSWHFMQLVPMRHPHDKFFRQTCKERRIATLHAGHGSLSIFAFEARCYLPPKDMRQFLHSITNSQNRHIPLLDKLPNFLGDMRRSLLVHAVRTSTQDHCGQLVLAQLLGRDETRVELAVDMELADAPCDEVRILAAEVEDGDLRTGKIAELR
mmetsp:Transcript_36144/g.61620  ORF Transcript_36144/g.61620 Transcript_36144/m.61620 type:complete len:405 (+) Transcript_36144:570-1784(+)